MFVIEQIWVQLMFVVFFFIFFKHVKVNVGPKLLGYKHSSKCILPLYLAEQRNVQVWIGIT